MGKKNVQHNIFNIYPNLYPLTSKLGYINLYVVCDKRAFVSFAPIVPYITYTFIQQIFPAKGCSTASDICTKPKLKWNNNCCGHWGAKGRVYCGFQEHSHQSQSFIIYPCQIILISENLSHVLSKLLVEQRVPEIHLTLPAWAV